MSRPNDSALHLPLFMHPAVFIGTAVLLGLLFALQEWVSMGMWSYRVSPLLLAEAWGVQYLLWGVICWLLWWRFGHLLQRANLRVTLIYVLPLSLAVSICEEMVWVLCFPDLPLNRPHMGFWHRIRVQLDAELVDNLVVFWSAFILFRGVGYYQQLREREAAAAELRTQLAHAQVRALRMQLNPHFLFNTMNSISSLMHVDIAAADTMLEQLSNLLRITLERGEVQRIPLSDEMAFIEMYLSMQDLRFTGRIRYELSVEPQLHDALVPAMLLQPLIENAYTHGLSKVESNGLLAIDVRRSDFSLVVSVFNSGRGLDRAALDGSSRRGVGLENVRTRLKLHYGENHSFSIDETPDGGVEVILALPLQLSMRPTRILTGYGV
jgi:two-component system, LytTR family, sensor kinase